MTEQLVMERVNKTSGDGVQRAYDVRDSLSRISLLSELSSNELYQLIENDEVELAIAHLAEVGQLRVYPFSQILREGMLGSEVRVRADGGGDKIVFRRIVTMLEARLTKIPDDNRGKLTLDLFEKVIEPTVNEMEIGDVLSFFSPPNVEGSFEFEYGFLYMYRKVGEQEGLSRLECTSVMMDIDISDYERVLAFHDSRLVSEGKGTLAERIMGRVMYFKSDELWGSGDVLQQIVQPLMNERGVVELFGEDVSDMNEWFDRGLAKYKQLQHKVAWGQERDDLVRAMASGNRQEIQRIVELMQLKVLEEYRRDIYEETMDKLDTYGEAVVQLACGLLSFGNGFGNDLNMTIVGVGEFENDIWICESCGHVHAINARVGELKERCEGCGKSGKC